MWGSLIMVILFSSVAIVELIASANYGLKGYLGPWLAGSIVLVAAVAAVVSDVRKRTAAKGGAAEKAEITAGIPRRRYVEMAVWFVGILVGVYLFGMIAGLTLFVFLFVRLNGWGWKVSICVGIVTFGILYGVFERALRLMLYPGIFLQ